MNEDEKVISEMLKVWLGKDKIEDIDQYKLKSITSYPGVVETLHNLRYSIIDIYQWTTHISKY